MTALCKPNVKVKKRVKDGKSGGPAASEPVKKKAATAEGEGASAKPAAAPALCSLVSYGSGDSSEDEEASGTGSESTAKKADD